MLRILAAAALCCALPACSSLTTITSGTAPNISPATVYKMEAAYGVVRAGLVAYRTLPWCSTAPAPCQTPAIASKVKKADAAAMAALAGLEAVSKAGDTLSIEVAYAAATQAVTAAGAIANAYSLKAR